MTAARVIVTPAVLALAWWVAGGPGGGLPGAGGLARAAEGAAPEAAGGKTYYVSVGGSDANDGLSAETSWKTITHAARKAGAGDTVHIKGGDYGHEHVVIRNSGTEKAPIVFQGYKDAPGEVPGPDRMPVLDGGDWTGRGIETNSCKYVELRNIKVIRYQFGVIPTKSEHVTLDNIVVDLGGSRNNGWGIYLNSAHHCIVRNCSVTDGQMMNFTIWHSNHNLMENCTSYGVGTDNAVDYYILIGYSHHNVVRNCLVHNMHRTVKIHHGHGITIKDNYHRGKYGGAHSHSNRIINCVSRGMGENLVVSHCAHHNEFINCTVLDDGASSRFHSKGLRARDGAHDNTFTNCRVVGTTYGVYFVDSSEGPREVQLQRNNAFVNCIFEDTVECGIFFSHTRDNVFRNCVFAGTPALFAARNLNRGNRILSSIITGVSAYGVSWHSRHPDPWVEKHKPNPVPDPDASDDVAVTYCDFWNNKFDKPDGTGNMSKDPMFIDAGNGDYRLKRGARAGAPARTARIWGGDRERLTAFCGGVRWRWKQAGVRPRATRPWRGAR